MIQSKLPSLVHRWQTRLIEPKTLLNLMDQRITTQQKVNLVIFRGLKTEILYTYIPHLWTQKKTAVLVQNFQNSKNSTSASCIWKAHQLPSSPSRPPSHLAHHFWCDQTRALTSSWGLNEGPRRPVSEKRMFLCATCVDILSQNVWYQQPQL